MGWCPRAVRGGLNIALLDIVGKATKAPIYRVLGGPTRNKARAITRLYGSSDDALQSDLEKQLTAGFRAFLIPIPAMPAARAIRAASLFALPQHGSKRCAPLPQLRTSPLKAHAQLTPGRRSQPRRGRWRACIRFGSTSLVRFPIWRRFAKSLRKPSFPWVSGARISDPGTFQDLLREGLVDLLRPDLLTHGISGVRRLSAMAETYYVDVAPWHEGGAIAHAAALHAAASMPNFFIAQSPNPGVGAAPHDGFFALPKGPGLGIEVDEKTFEGNRIA